MDELATKTLYSVKIDRITLREMLVFKSLQLCKRMADIQDIVKLQPLPGIFFKSFFELDFSNMVSILSFNSGAMSHLLSDNYKEFAEARIVREVYYPLFYKNKIVKGSGDKAKYFYRSAVDIAFNSHSTEALRKIIDYIVTYQNHLMSSFLFIDLMPRLIESGIKVHSLLSSRVFCVPVDYDGWPSTHPCPDEAIKPYNRSIFQLGKHYRDVFPEAKYEPPAQVVDGADDPSRGQEQYKIEYWVNVLPMIGQHFHYEKNPWTKRTKSELQKSDVYFTTLCADSDEIEMFQAQPLQDLLEFKWNIITF